MNESTNTMKATQSNAPSELISRLELMETMLQEGRQATVHWGWSFVLWGAAYLVAILWSSMLHSWKPWTITMVGTAVVSIVVGKLNRRGKPSTQSSRSISSIWTAVSIGLFLYTFGISGSGHFELHGFWASVEVLLGVVNFASAMILRWRVQFLVGLMWFSSALATCFVSSRHVLPILLADVVFGMIIFGLYLMYCERRDRKLSTLPSVSHA